jgi:hypothetical protein
VPKDEWAHHRGPTLKDGFMAPPAGPVQPERNDVLGMWHSEYKLGFDLGTLFTVVAGLLNLLAVYDAFDGPVIFHPRKRKKRRPAQGDQTSAAGREGKHP